MTGPVWRRSSRCEATQCVEVADEAGRVLVRDGKLADGSPVLEFAPGSWAAFVAGARVGEFDGPPR